MTHTVESLYCVFLCFSKFPDDGIPAPKHAGADTCHELYFMICILLYLSEFVG